MFEDLQAVNQCCHKHSCWDEQAKPAAVSSQQISAPVLDDTHPHIHWNKYEQHLLVVNYEPYPVGSSIFKISAQHMAGMIGYHA